LALIPARGGSKGLPGKNLLSVGGVPLVSGVVDRILVSTDCPETAAVAERYGAEVPFLRPSEISTDEASSLDVALHTLEVCGPVEELVLLQPTSPLRTSEDVRAAKYLLVNEAPAVVSVVQAETHPWLVSTIDPDGRLAPFGERPAGYLRRQDLPRVFRLNGAVYWIKVAVLVRERSFTPPGTKAYVMPPERSVDIDTAADLELAEWIVSREVAV
jgi:CMP-N-acetylneuraminic acid synthetase